MYTTSELDPCIFCNGSECDNELSVNNRTIQNGETIWFVKCLRCGSTGPEKSTRSEAVEAWNNRHEFRLRRDGMEFIRIKHNNNPMDIAKDAFIMTGIFAFRTAKSIDDPVQPGELCIRDSSGETKIFYILDFYECACGRKQPKAAENKLGIGERAAEAVGWRKVEGQWRCPFCCNNTDALFNVFKKIEENEDQEPTEKDEEDPLDV